MPDQLSPEAEELLRQGCEDVKAGRVGALPDQEMCEHCSSWGPDWSGPCCGCGAVWPAGGVRCPGGHVVTANTAEAARADDPNAPYWPCVYCARGEPAHG